MEITADWVCYQRSTANHKGGAKGFGTGPWASGRVFLEMALHTKQAETTATCLSAEKGMLMRIRVRGSLAVVMHATAIQGRGIRLPLQV